MKLKWKASDIWTDAYPISTVAIGVDWALYMPATNGIWAPLLQMGTIELLFTKMCPKLSRREG